MRYSVPNSLALVAALVPLVSAHGFVQTITVNGESYPGADPVWFYYPEGELPQTVGWDALNQDLGFVSPSDFSSTDIACHKSAFPSGLYINANAGDTLTLQWNTWPDSHKGPIINYIAPCNGRQYLLYCDIFERTPSCINANLNTTCRRMHKRNGW